MYDIIVIGGGHAGVEASLASARLGNKTLMVLGNINRISNMPCNPSIGGPAKGILVREIDALGGEMGKAADATLLQMKMLNSSKGPAVRALRAQSDKVRYPKYMKDVCMNTENLDILEALVRELIVKDNTVCGIKTDKEEIMCKAVIIASGTYLDSRVLVGHKFWQSGPDNEKTTSELSKSLRSLGLELIRLKTGTPPRLKKDTIDYTKTRLEPGDKIEYHFSEETEHLLPYDMQEPCYLTRTTKETHQIIMENLDKSSMYGGIVEGVGPRYCPSIEDKVVRFNTKESHQVFLEPESLVPGSEEFDQIYPQGFSTSMPHDVQEKMIRTLPGLENVVILKYAYAIEYDAINPLELKANLETKKINNLFFAGQVNGTSGYEEAACQGLMAGINANLKLKGKEPLILRRDEAYIGVLIDDLITKGVKDPYRLLTSRAEYRLLLRHDNASERLIKYGKEIGLISEERYNRFLQKREKIDEIKNKLKEIYITPKNEFNAYLLENGKSVINEKVNAYDFLKRPNIDLEDIKQFLGVSLEEVFGEAISEDLIVDQLLIEIKYEGYIIKEYREASKLKQMESRKIPEDIKYEDVPNVAKEAIEKLNKIRPSTLAQASRISGVNPSDITMILLYLESRKRHENK